MKKILIVEDELIVRSIYRRKYELSGYKVETAEEGTVALNLMAAFKPDAVQVDIMLPGMDGVEVIRQIRTWPEFKSIPILVVSSFYRPDLAAEAWRAGATKCVSKMDCTPNLALELMEQMLSGDNTGILPFAKFGMVTMPEASGEGGIRLLPAESPWEEATQIITRKPKPAAGAPPPPPVSRTPMVSTPKPPSTLPTFSKEQPAPAATTTPTFAKPDPEGTGHTTRPTFARPAAQKLTKPGLVSDAPAVAAAPLPSASSHAFNEDGTLAPAVAATPSSSASPWAKTTDAVTAGSSDGTADNADFRLEIRQEFLKRAPQIQTDLRDRVGALIKSKSTIDQIALLPELETSVASLASLSGITGFSRISHLAGALEALIKDLRKKPAQMTNSVLRTIAHASDCLNMLFHDLERTPRDIPQSMLILAVDDEPIARRTIAIALAKSNLRCIGMEDSRAALTILRENPFDLIFLDAEMPGLNGFELCGELRKLPTNKATPVIFVTSLTKFEVRAQSSLAGGNDLIAKPFLMMELAVKALTYLLKPQPIVDPKTH
jgi:CheY-like chemotaxis protein